MIFHWTKTYGVGTQKDCRNETVFANPKQMLKLMNKKILTIFHSISLFILTYFLLSKIRLLP